MLRSLLFLCLLAGTLSAAEPIPKSDGTPVKKGFLFPQVNPKTVPPAPAPAPGAVPMLTGDTLYVIPSDEPFLLFDSPRGLVSVTRESGPLKIRGKFLDGNGKVETRTYTAKNIAIVEGTGKGRVELIAVPQGITDESNAVRMLVDVNQAPQPPPGPDPKPDPKPDPVVTSFRVIWIYESASTDKAHQTANTVASAKVVRDYLDANTTKNGTDSGWRRWDKDNTVGNDYPVFKELWQAVQPQVTAVPCVAIEVNGKVSIEPQPQTPQAALALFKKFTGK